ncbi:hypothetical protein GG851_02475 [Bordetella petrii]|nr:hypothetical protein [Bordetella petrii]
MASSSKAGRPAPAVAAPNQKSAVPPNQYPLFKGATRIATIKGGVPTRAFMGLVFVTVVIAMFTLWGWLVGPVLYPVLAVLSRNDDRAFWIWELWLRTKFLARNKRFWGAVSLTPTPHSKRRPWRRQSGGHKQ